MSKAGFSLKPRLYIPKCRRNDTPPPAFMIRRLTPLELQDISEKYSTADETIELGGIEEEASAEEQKTSGEQKEQGRKIKISLKTLGRLVKSKFSVLEVAISGWENVDDEDGQPISFSKENVHCLDMDIVNELSEVAQGTISAVDAKNSESPSA